MSNQIDGRSSTLRSWLVALIGLALLSVLSWQVGLVVGLVAAALYVLLGSGGRAAQRPALRWTGPRR